MISFNKLELFTAQRLPARLDAQHTADLLGFQPQDIQILVRARLLIPLGNPAQNGTKWFATDVLLDQCRSEDWLHKASRAVTKYHQQGRKRADAIQN